MLYSKSRRSGFTLVEIMIVVVLIGLLAALAVPAIRMVRERSTEKVALNDLRQLAGAADQYFVDSTNTSVSLTDLIPTYVRTLNPQNTYPSVFNRTDTSLNAILPDGSTVTYP